jgi:hypothetical protein
MLCTIKEDSMGSLHIWKGDVTPSGYKYTWRVDGIEADLYIQEGMGAEQFKEELSKTKQAQLRKGYAITANVLDEYFPEEDDDDERMQAREDESRKETL